VLGPDGWIAAAVRPERVQERKVRAPRKIEWRVIPAEGNLRESATESKPPNLLGKGERVR